VYSQLDEIGEKMETVLMEESESGRNVSHEVKPEVGLRIQLAADTVRVIVKPAVEAFVKQT